MLDLDDEQQAENDNLPPRAPHGRLPLSFWLIFAGLLILIAGIFLWRIGPAAAGIYVTDGDTIVLTSPGQPREVVRIVGLDAPETRQAKCDSELQRGLDAKAGLMGLLSAACGDLAKAEPSRCLGIARLPRRDRYGRTLANITAGGRDVTAAMIGAGWARPYDCPNGRCPRRAGWCGGGG
ncbi:thermonuclease family protein [Ancylobacter sp.]|uniref:thermonuclease family protein n=1 Tax=Ancylobacter sp. TaxID=1872567 RepID=UPI003D0C464E